MNNELAKPDYPIALPDAELSLLADKIVQDKIHRARAGSGYSHPNLNNMRKFYLMFPNFQTSEKLTWSHICELKRM